VLAVRARRAWALLALILVLRRSCVRPAQPPERAAQGGAPAELREGERGFLKAGSLYQNAYMTLWNANGMPISVTLRVLQSERFELSVQHLNSKGGGSEGWFALHGAFGFQALEGAAGQLRLMPEADGEGGFLYDETLMDRATAFACRCLQKLGGLLGALELAVDTTKDAVLVTPRAAAVRMLWSEPVVLHLTSEDELWKPGLPREGAAAGLLVVS